jgi:deoxyhypusine monooxygenase
MSQNDSKIPVLQKTLTDPSQPLAKRFRAIFLLKSIGSSAALDALAAALYEDESALLRHEVAYCIGQIQLPEAIPILQKSLASDSDSMVRHEAGEALGAIGTKECLEILEQYLDDPCVEVKETCEIAVAAVKWKLEHPEEKDKAFPSCEMFSSIDPAPPSKEKDVEQLKKELIDANAPLFGRYKAMFSLRNLANEEAVLALCEGFQEEKSALFRHEIAYVLGQLQHPASAPSLQKVLLDKEENAMVRHEAAEALGAIATSDCTEFLKTFVEDEERVVRESCDIALDMADYFTSDQFQYAEI